MWWTLRRLWKWWMRTQSVSLLSLAPLSMESLKMSSSWMIYWLRRTRNLGMISLDRSTFINSYMYVTLNPTRISLFCRWETPIHVDAASGGFIAPFIYPDLEWDFRLPLVKRTNVSGHKYGLVYAGIGWVIWRSKEDLPEELIFHINYLGADQPTFTLNFSKGY